MIRNVVVGRVRPGTELSVIQEALDAIVALPVEGRLGDGVGQDGPLRGRPAHHSTPPHAALRTTAYRIASVLARDHGTAPSVTRRKARRTLRDRQQPPPVLIMELLPRAARATACPRATTP